MRTGEERWAVVVALLATLVPAARAHAEDSTPDGRPPVLQWNVDRTRIAVPMSAGLRLEAVSGFPVDTRGSRLSVAPGLLGLARLGLTIERRDPHKGRGGVLEAEVELRGAPLEPDLAVARSAYERRGAVELRKLGFRATLAPWLHLAAGAMTSHWGLGLVANDGAHGWTPGSARFADPVGGDRVLRALVAVGPVTRAAGLRGFLGADRVLGDDAMVKGDIPYQLVGGALVGSEERASAGVYVVRRHQTSAAGGRLDVWVVDATGRVALHPGGAWRLTVEAEAVAIVGTTTLAPTLEVGSQDVLQLGAALRATAATRRFGVILDFLFASGDGNLYDHKQQGFRPDVNYDMGLLLFRQVAAGQTGRGQVNASDPTLVGYPPMGAERVATGGSATSTAALFPRVVWRPGAFDVYGGPLLAFTPVRLVDPFATRISGTAGQNALGGTGGHFLGVEVDAGVRFRRRFRWADLTVGLEVGVLVPGNAFDDASGGAMGAVYGGRLLCRLDF